MNEEQSVEKMTVKEFNLKAQKLKIMREAGIISQDEFDYIKNKLMEELRD